MNRVIVYDLYIARREAHKFVTFSSKSSAFDDANVWTDLKYNMYHIILKVMRISTP